MLDNFFKKVPYKEKNHVKATRNRPEGMTRL